MAKTAKSANKIKTSVYYVIVFDEYALKTEINAAESHWSGMIKLNIDKEQLGNIIHLLRETFGDRQWDLKQYFIAATETADEITRDPIQFQLTYFPMILAIRYEEEDRKRIEELANCVKSNVENERANIKQKIIGLFDDVLHSTSNFIA